jgi:hypothetical protein
MWPAKDILACSQPAFCKVAGGILPCERLVLAFRGGLRRKLGSVFDADPKLEGDAPI